MAQLGMDVDQVEHLGHQLRDSVPSQIDSLIHTINGYVSHMEQIWWGHDAQEFCNTWWPQHRSDLQKVSESIKGLGQSALNNASAQRTASSH